MTQLKKKGDLILVPSPLGASNPEGIPAYNREIVGRCLYFIVESMKIGRRNILGMSPGKDLQDCHIEVMEKDTDPLQYISFLDPALEGHDICLLSDAGSPTIADPGSPIVRMAHRKGIKVRPLSGPSAILQALMASGFNGQQFIFHGYLSPKKKEIRKELKELERQAHRGVTQIFMETPYRNLALFGELLKLKPETQLCLATNVSTPSESISMQSIGQWKAMEVPNIHKQPTIFLLGD